MDLICPLCNGLTEYNLKCPNCNRIMNDTGSITNYFDDYSPYLPYDITQRVDGVAYDKCVHLYKCEGCKKDTRIEVNKVRI